MNVSAAAAVVDFLSVGDLYVDAILKERLIDGEWMNVLLVHVSYFGGLLCVNEMVFSKHDVIF